MCHHKHHHHHRIHCVRHGSCRHYSLFLLRGSVIVATLVIVFQFRLVGYT